MTSSHDSVAVRSSADARAARPRYALCGLSGRGLTQFALPLLGLGEADDPYGDMSVSGELVAVIDIDQLRAAAFLERTGARVQVYGADQFQQMTSECHPDVVIVASPDHTHWTYCVAALEQDIPVICEKPLTADCQQARAVLNAELASNASVRVAHNLRYVERNRQIKRLIQQGAIGKVVSVELAWSVDTYHGASYFQRWNRDRGNSGGLSITKGCHHFDLVNWWLDDVPEKIFAFGALNYFGSKSPHRPAVVKGTRNIPATEHLRCPYAKRWQDLPTAYRPGVPDLVSDLPYDVQYPPGEQMYIYDDDIDIEDTYSAVVRFRTGASLAYSVSFSGPWEGFTVGINGTHGRIEASSISFRDGETPAVNSVVHYPMFGAGEHILIDEVHNEGHEGADPLVRREAFLGASPETIELGAQATALDAAHAVAVGEGIWKSVRDGRPYTVDELLGPDV